MFRKLLDSAEAGENVGVLLRGVKKEDVERGQVICKPGSIKPHTKFKGQVYVLSKEEGGRHTPFFNGYRPQFFFRTTDVTGTMQLADLGADLDACLVISPGPERWERGLVMARALVTAGMPWVGVALGGEQSRPSLWEHALAALAEAVAKRGAICVIATPAPADSPRFIPTLNP